MSPHLIGALICAALALTCAGFLYMAHLIASEFEQVDYTPGDDR